MITNLTKQDLIDFEEEIANEFNNGKIRAPIHLQTNCFNALIDIFKDVYQEDWIIGSWRFHAETLLKGVPKEELKRAILDRKSISLCFPQYKTFASAIVGGNLSIGMGISISIKRQKLRNKVWVFCGDMTSTTGTFFECLSYSICHELPITFIVADNLKSVCTDTRKVWNVKHIYSEPENAENDTLYKGKDNYLWYYRYKLDYPHSGAGKRVEF